MIKCEMHMHILGISPCARVAPQEIAKIYHEAGYGAVTVTNHYMKYLFKSYDIESEEGKIKFYIDSYKSLKDCCAPYGIKIFLGMELNPDCLNTPENNPGVELLCYGVTEEFLYKNPRLYDLTQKEFFKLAENNGILVYQAHPFRGYCLRADPRYMHGVEIYNGHPFHDSHNNLAEEFAKEHNLKGISGSDFHETGNTVRGGIYIPEDINDSKGLAGYLKGNTPLLIREMT